MKLQSYGNVFLGIVVTLLLMASAFGGLFMYNVSLDSLSETVEHTARAELIVATQALNRTYQTKVDLVSTVVNMLTQSSPPDFTDYRSWIQRLLHSLSTNRDGVGLDMALGVVEDNPFGPKSTSDYFYSVMKAPPGSQAALYDGVFVSHSNPGLPQVISACQFASGTNLGCGNYTLPKLRYLPQKWGARWRSPSVTIIEGPDGKKQPFWYSGYDYVVGRERFPPQWSFVESVWIFANVWYDSWTQCLHRYAPLLHFYPLLHFFRGTLMCLHRSLGVTCVDGWANQFCEEELMCMLAIKKGHPI